MVWTLPNYLGTLMQRIFVQTPQHPEFEVYVFGCRANKVYVVEKIF